MRNVRELLSLTLERRQDRTLLLLHVRLRLIDRLGGRGHPADGIRTRRCVFQFRQGLHRVRDVDTWKESDDRVERIFVKCLPVVGASFEGGGVVGSSRKAGGGGRFSRDEAGCTVLLLLTAVFVMEAVLRIGGGGLFDCTDARRNSVVLMVPLEYTAVEYVKLIEYEHNAITNISRICFRNLNIFLAREIDHTFIKYFYFIISKHVLVSIYFSQIPLQSILHQSLHLDSECFEYLESKFSGLPEAKLQEFLQALILENSRKLYLTKILSTQ